MIVIIIVINAPLFRRILQAVNFSHLEHKMFIGGMALDQFFAEKKHRPVSRIAIHGKFPAPMGFFMAEIKRQQ